MKSRSEVGGNNPPADASFTLHIDELFSLLSDTLAGGKVATDEQEAAIDALAKDFLKAKQDADKARAAEKKPHDDAAKEVQTRWKPIVDKAARGQCECLDALAPFRIAKQKAKDDAARKAREEAEEREKAAQEALRQSDDLDARYQAEQELEQAKKLTAVANKIDRSATGLRTYWTAEITDRKAALLHLIKVNPEAFSDLIQALADQEARAARRPIPGVLYHENKKAA